MTAEILPLRRGSGRHSAAAEAAFDAQLELAVHTDEALQFVEDCAPLISAIGRVVLELGPREYQLIRQLRRRHELYALRHTAPDDSPMEQAA